ncbi:hypothetical protein ASPZODRAFT_70600, partial [Penicilliopsis zonata CBS 506.65]
EVAQLSLRAHTQALGTVVTGVAGMTWAFILPYLVNPNEANLGGKIGILAFCGLGGWYYFPGKNGKSFAEIDTLYEAKVAS